ncbi:MAG TPA: N-acetylglucosamine-6-phosphate deacetylase [Acidobacteriota bacterium]|nr:N-acetylglucosamine-6-phosphate deacetylase [Acidobacteriota bacterium]
MSNSVPMEDKVWVWCDTLFTPSERRVSCCIRIEDGKIQEIVPAGESAVRGRDVVHEPGTVVAPGFIDLHVHGARGRDFMDGTLESLRTLSETLARHGTTSFLPTTMSAPDLDTEAVLRGFAEHRSLIRDGALPIGIHMEGPFLNPVCRGTHDARYLKQADVPAFRRFRTISRDSIARITVAPEMDEDLALIREATAAGIQVSIGHSDATAAQAQAAIEAGACQATHTFNAMRPFHQREPGILGTVLADKRVFAEVICDGIHVHRTAIRLLLGLKQAGRTLLVTDGLSSVDMPDGRYPLGDKIIVVERAECRDSEGRLAGSTLTLDRAVRNLVHWFNVPLSEALATAGATPARAMRMEGKKGVIAPGADADLVFLDADLNVVRTMVSGRTVYSKSATDYTNSTDDKHIIS